MNFDLNAVRSSRSTLIVVGGSLVAIIGSFLAWASVEGISVSGTDGGDGTLTLILGLITAALAVFLLGRGRSRQIGVAIAAALIILIAVINIADVNSVASDFGGIADVSVGFGLWLVLIGGIVALAGAFVKDA